MMLEEQKKVRGKRKRFLVNTHEEMLLLNQRIMDLSVLIQERYPELNDAISELAITIPDEKNPVISQTVLTNYYGSLKSFLKNFIQNYDQSGSVN